MCWLSCSPLAWTAGRGLVPSPHCCWVLLGQVPALLPATVPHFCFLHPACLPVYPTPKVLGCPGTCHMTDSTLASRQPQRQFIHCRTAQSLLPHHICVCVQPVDSLWLCNLLLWPAGKTTLLRDVASVLANKFQKRVVVVDTHSEIGGTGSVPHACLGQARRLAVLDSSRQHEVLLEAACNHKPEVTVHCLGAGRSVNTGPMAVTWQHNQVPV